MAGLFSKQRLVRGVALGLGSLAQSPVEEIRRGGQVGDGETPVAVGVRVIGADGFPTDGRRQVGGRLQDVGIIRRAGTPRKRQNQPRRRGRTVVWDVKESPPPGSKSIGNS